MFRTSFRRCPIDGGVLAPLDEDPLIGRRFADRYMVEELIGEGGMGRVYRARHANMSRTFAVKVLFGDLAADETMRARFAHEAEVASRLDHPNLISVVDFGETSDSLLYLVMDHVDGDNLGTLIDEQGPFSVERTIALTRGMCQGLQAAHQHGLVHRDFKPDNVIIVKKGDEEIPKIVDFGLAILPENEAPVVRLTSEGVVLGTPSYMSPEQACDRRVDHRADLFGLGVIMYEMLAGSVPFSGTSQEIVHQNVALKPPPISSWESATIVPPALEQIIFKLMAKKPIKRFGFAAHVVAALDKLEEATGDAADTEIVAAHPPARARLPWAVAAAVIAVAIVALFVAVGGSGYEDRDTTLPPEPTSAPVVAVSTQTDATPPEAPPTRRTKPRKRRARKRARSPEPPSAPKQVAAEQLTSSYRAVGRAIDKLERTQGADAAAAYRDRYFAIPYADAMRRPQIRFEVAGRLSKLRRDVRKASR